MALILKGENMYKSCRKSRNLMSLFSMRPITLVVALCLFALGGFAAAETLQDCSDQINSGENFTFSFPFAEQSPGVEEGILTLHIRGDYSI